MINSIFVVCQGEYNEIFQQVEFDNGVPENFVSHDIAEINNELYSKYYHSRKSFDKVTRFYDHFKQIPDIDVNDVGYSLVNLLLCLKELKKNNKAICNLVIDKIIRFHSRNNSIKMGQ